MSNDEFEMGMDDDAFAEGGLLEGFDLDETFEADLDADGAPKPQNRYYCAGADRKDEDGKKFCTHKALQRWEVPCPACGRWYDCKRIKKTQNETKMEMTLADMDKVKEMEHHPTGIPELDIVLGGGLVYGKVILFAGRRGSGKTRILLQLASKFGKAKRCSFFASGEDDRDSVIQFAQTLQIPKSDYVIVHGNAQGLVIDELIEKLRHRHVKLLIIDSAQAVAHSGSKADFRTQEQIGKVCGFLVSFARQAKIAVILIGQITEEDEMAGGSALKHGVDLLVRFDPYPLTEADGSPVPGGENVRMLWVDGKSRQGRSNVVSYMEMSDENGSLQPLSRRLLQKIAKLEAETAT